jgi:hypothetical protein
MGRNGYLGNPDGSIVNLFQSWLLMAELCAKSGEADGKVVMTENK